MSSILHKKQQFKKQVEDTFKEHQDLVRYIKNVLLVKRPIDFGVLIVLVTFFLYYLKDFNISAISFISFSIVIFLMLQVIITNFSFKFITKVLPIQDSKESYDDIINLIIKIRFSFSDSLSELNRFRHVNPTKFNIQTSLVFGVLGLIGVFFSGFTIISILIYTLLFLPYILYGKKPQNTQGTANDILNNIIIIGKPIVEAILVYSQQLYKYLLDLATSKQQPSPGIPNPNYSNNNNNNNNMNSSSNINNNINNVVDDLGKVGDSFVSLAKNINNTFESNDINNKLKQGVNNIKQQFNNVMEEDENQYPEENFNKSFKNISNNNSSLKKRF